MNRKIRKVMALLIAAAVFAVFSSAALAQEMPDLDETGSISLTFKDSRTGSLVPGGSVSLYKVADIVSGDTGLSYEYTEAFSSCEAELTDLTSDTLISLLTVIAQQENVTALVGTAGQNGVCLFDELELGLYLVVQTSPAQGYYAVSPFLVTIPLSGEDGWDYDVDASPKMEAYEKITTTTSSTTSTTSTTSTSTTTTTTTTQNSFVQGDSDKLPQTGQLNWPIPVLAVSGILLFFFGWGVVFGGKKEQR